MRRLFPLLACLATAGAVRAEEDASLARYLPVETPFLFEIRTPPPDELKGMCMSRMLTDPQLKDLLERVTGEDGTLGSAHVSLGQAKLVIRSDVGDPALAVHVLYSDGKGDRRFKVENRLSFAWVAMSDGAFPRRKGEPASLRQLLDLVVALRVNTDPKFAAETIQRIAAAASLHLRGIKDGDIDKELERFVQHASHRDVGYAWVTLGPAQLCLAPVGRLVVLTTSEARLKDIIDRHLDGGESLATDPRHRRMLEDAAGTGTATTTIQLHVDRALQAIGSWNPQVAAQINGSLRYVGLDSLQSLTTVARVDGEGIASTTALNISDTHRGLGRLFAPGKPAKLKALEFAPKDSLYAYCGTLDAPALLDMVVEIGGLEAAMAQNQFEGMFGLKLREQVLALLGPEAAVIVAPNKGLIPDVALVLESPDAARLEKALLSILSHVSWPAGTGVRGFKVGDVNVHTVPLGHPKLTQVPIAPTFGIVDGRLLVTAYPLSFQRFLSVQQGRRPNLAQNRDFAGLRDRVPEGAASMSYLDLKRLFEVLYDTGIPLLQSLADQPGPSPLYEFPEVEVFTKHLFGRVAWTTSDESGLKWNSYGAIDTSGFWLGSLGAGAGAWMVMARQDPGTGTAPPPPPAPRLDAPGDREMRTCRYRVRLLRARIRLYQGTHSRLPDALGQLEAEHVKPETFLVPGAREKPYVYLGPAGRGGVLLHGYPNGKDKRLCVLMLENLEMKRITADELARLLGK
ncbi:MAG: DUF3352 domain-containing protein [Planctomycetota bacterium]|jgi:hypothetical protein